MTEPLTSNPLRCRTCRSDNTIAGAPYWRHDSDRAESIVQCHDCGGDFILSLQIAGPSGATPESAIPREAYGQLARCSEVLTEPEYRAALTADRKVVSMTARRSEQHDELIPCDVAVAPATILGVGCSLSIVLATIRHRQGVQPPPHFRRQILARILPPEILADTGELVARDVARLQDRKPPRRAMHVTAEELAGIVRVRVAEITS
jgi:hypothetical protein